MTTFSTPHVTGATTLEELKLLRAKYGVHRLWLDYGGDHPRPVTAHVEHGRFSIVGSGADEAEAIDDALSRLIHRIAEMTPQQVGGKRCLP